MPDNLPDENARFLHYQKLIATYIAAMYFVEQQKAAEQVPRSWRPLYINLVHSQIILPNNPRRCKLKIWNTGPSDLFISNAPIEPTTILQQFNGVSGIALAVVIAKNGGDPIELDTTGAVHAMPVNYGQAEDFNCIINATESVYTLSNNAGQLGVIPSKVGEAGKRWNATHETLGDLLV